MLYLQSITRVPSCPSVYGEVPYTITDEEYLKAEVKRLIDYRVGPIEGFTSNYDYEKGKWKN